MTDQAPQDAPPDRIIVRHRSGSKANQIEEFPLAQYTVISIGRTATSSMKYDPDLDDLVSREHAKIRQDPDDPTCFTIEDLNSRNGTFVNKQRIAGATPIRLGDVVQLGPGGPEFEFDLEPRPAGAAGTAGRDTSPFARATRASTPAAQAGAWEGGEVTGEHAASQAQGEPNRVMKIGGISFLVLVVVVLLFALLQVVF